MKQLHIYTIRKDEIIAMDFTRSSKLRKLFDSLTLVVAGYDDHIEEIYMIPEVRKFFAELHRRWPWWTYFVCNMEASLAILYLCLVDHVESYKRAKAPMCAAAFNPVHLLELIEHDFGRMNDLMDRAGMSDQENEKRSKEILDLFLAGNGGAK